LAAQAVFIKRLSRKQATLALASLVMFWSPDAGVYEANRAIFYRYGFVCTIVYFVFAYWALRRRLALNKHRMAITT
jgi:hypothetical protein